jgi:hypothetical protein
MSTAAAFTAIRAYLTANWATTPMAWENEAFSKPSPPAPFVLVQITGDIWDQASIGAGDRTTNRWQEEGALMLDVIVPAGTGSLTARTHATALANLFRGLQLGDIEFRDISIGLGVAADDRGPWFLLPMRVAWIKG